MKALLALHGSDDAWSDQPPLLKLLHTGLLSVFGTDISVLRALEVCFSAALLMSLWAILGRVSGKVAGVVAIVLLGLSSDYLKLSAACLVGMPACAWAMLACACLVSRAGSRPQIWVPLSGFLLGLGAQTKMSALLVLPAILAWLWWLRKTCKECPWSRGHVILHWLIGFLISFLGILFMSPQSLTSIASAHWGSATSSPLKNVSMF